MATLKYCNKRFKAIKPPSSVPYLLSFLAKLPADELFDSKQISRMARVSELVLNHYAVEYLSDHYAICGGHKRYWGSKKAIRELRRQMGRGHESL